MLDYLNIAKAEDLKNNKERALYRLLEILPGFLSWTTLSSAFLLSWLAPSAAAIFIILFDLYWLLKIGYLSFHQIAAFKQMRKNLKQDWLKKLEEGPFDWKKIYHLITLPSYRESRETIEATIECLASSDYPKDRLMVVLSMEEGGGESGRKIAEEMKKRFSKSFFRFLTTTHPRNLAQETTGKGSNTAWAINEARERIILPLKIPPENIIVSIFDIDTRPYPQYFACLTFRYLTSKNPCQTSYQPLPVYNNNIWLAPSFSRVIASSGTFWQMMQQERPEILTTFSSHAISFKTLEEVGYPKNVVSDDSRMFWKSYLFYGGDYRVLPLHYPVSMDAVFAKTLRGTIVNQYKQQRRWAWGCSDIAFLLFGFSKNRKIAFSDKLRHSLNILDGFWSWSTSSLLIFFLGWLPLILGGGKFSFTLLSYNLPRLTGNLMTLAMVGMLVSGVLSFLLLPPRPKNLNAFKNLSMVLQWLLLPLTLIFLGALPALDAQTRLIFKKYLGFWPTEKAEASFKPNRVLA